MTIFNRRLSEYFAFTRPFLILIIAVGLIRLALSLAGAPNSTAKWLSVTAFVWFGTVVYAIRIHSSRFGSYKQFLVVCVLMNLAAQTVIVAGIVLAMLTGTDNIYSAPEYAFGSDNKLLHLGAHLVLGTTFGSLIPWLVGSVILFAVKKSSGKSAQTSRA